MSSSIIHPPFTHSFMYIKKHTISYIYQNSYNYHPVPGYLSIYNALQFDVATYFFPKCLEVRTPLTPRIMLVPGTRIMFEGGLNIHVLLVLLI